MPGYDINSLKLHGRTQDNKQHKSWNVIKYDDWTDDKAANETNRCSHAMMKAEHQDF
jgi:hypothetical protein